MGKWILLGVLILGSLVLGVSQQVLVYAALDEPTLQAIAEAFTAKTGIRVVWLTGGAGELAARIRAEAARPQADVFIGGSTDIHGDLALAGLLESIDPPNAVNIPGEFKDPQGRYFGWYLGVLGLVINTELLSELGLPEPKTWDDLLAPQWKGYVVSANPATAGSGYIFLCTQIFRFEIAAPFFGFTGDQRRKEAEAAAWKWFEQFKANVSQFTAKATEPITLVAQGQAVAGMSWAHDILTWIEQGYPLKLVIPPYTGYEIGGVSVIKGAPHLQEAIAFVNFVLSKEAQTINATVGAKRYPVSLGVPSPANAPAFETVVLVPYDRAWAIANRSRLLDEWERRIAR